jgi:putative Holliday junction resolvase
VTGGKLLGIDHGIRRIGIAVSDASRLVARELTIIQRRSRAEDFAQINQIANAENVVAIIVGVPVNYEAHEGQDSQARTVRRWIKQLAKNTQLQIIQWDEQLSSADARELARSKKRKPGDPIDDLAARIILQTYLDALRDGLAETPA